MTPMNFPFLFKAGILLIPFSLYLLVGMYRKERNSGLGKAAKTKREQLLKATAVGSLLLLYPNAYSLLLANFFVFWHLKAGIEEILADYVHHAMTREFVTISLRLFLIIAMKDVCLKFIFV